MLCRALKVQEVWSLDVGSHCCCPLVNLFYLQSPTFYQLPLLRVAAPRASPRCAWAWPLTVPHLTPHPVSLVHPDPCQPFSSSSSSASESNPASTADFFLSKYSLSLCFSSFFSVHLATLGFHPLPARSIEATSRRFTGRQLFLLMIPLFLLVNAPSLWLPGNAHSFLRTQLRKSSPEPFPDLHSHSRNPFFCFLSNSGPVSSSVKWVY